MEKLNPSNYDLPTRVFWWLAVSTAAALLAWSFYGVAAYSTAQVAVLLIAVVLSVFANQHQLIVPRTNAQLTAKEFVVFWAVIQLGAPGGVLLAAASAAVQHFCLAERRARSAERSWFAAAADIAAAFAAGVAFSVAAPSASELSGALSGAENSHVFGWLAAAALVAAVAHSAVAALSEAVFERLANRAPVAASLKEILPPAAVRYAIGIVAAVALHLAFLEFGLYFSLVVVPLVIFAHLAHRLHVQRFEEKTRQISDASRIQSAIIEVLATAIDARDQVGMGHVRRTQIYAVGIGELLKLSAAEIEALNTGALLHDIGKLAVPDHILNKPGRLTPAEFEKMKIHASVGASILEKVPFNAPVVPTVKHHHEMWDGSGYPEGLRGENIPLTARVLAVADAYDTLRGARPYRAAVSRDEARRFLINGAGKQFDPNIVDVFLRNLGKFEAVVEAQRLGYKFDRSEAIHISAGNGAAKSSYVEQIKRANREVFALYELARVFGSSINLQETLRLLAEKIGELVPFDTCAVYLLDETEAAATAVYVEGANKAAFKNKRAIVGEGATGFVLQKREPMQNIEPELDFMRGEMNLNRPYKTMTALPLVAGEKLLGAVSLYSCELESYEEEHLRLLETIARIASDAIGKSLQHAATESRALTDPMTDLPNARSLQMQFEKETARASRSGAQFHLLMLDLDGFKAVNDTFGHKTGDRLLHGLARVMRAQLRDYDFLARYAGDEFVALVPETDQEGIQDLSRRIERAVDEFALPAGEGGAEARVGVSIGIGCYPNHGATLDQIIVHADQAMYAVKAHRKRSRDTQRLPPLDQIVAPSAGGMEEIGITAEPFIVELDESHVVSAAVN